MYASQAPVHDRPVRRYQECRPDELAEIVRDAPILFWPLGLIEHHGWHLPLGLDGIKAERICQLIAQRTGGLLLPTMWWGGEGGHGGFMWTYYQPEEAAESILVNTVTKSVGFGFRVLVLELLVTDGRGAEHSLTRVELAPEMKTQISALGTWHSLVTLPDDSVSLRVRLRRHSCSDQPVLDLLDRTIELEPYHASQ